MNILRAILGLVVLATGRKLFWLVVGVVGFLIGVSLATRFFGDQPAWVILLVALAAGLLGALLTVFLQTVAIALAGFAGGGYIALSLLSILGVQPPQRLAWLPFVLGGIIGLVLMLALFDWALIVLSSLVGASMVVQAVDLGRTATGVLFIVLVIAGIVIQASLLQREVATPSGEG